MDSILTSVKKLLGLTEEYTAFDADLNMHINSVLMILRQSYTALKVRMLFDPPQNSATMEATKNLISELEWRLYAECDREDE